MNEDQFWTLVAETRRSFFADQSRLKPNESGMLEGVMDWQEHELEKALSELPSDEVVEFDRLFTLFRRRAYRWDLWAAAYIMGGGCSDDGFMDFRTWLISMGRGVYEAALSDPETLVDVAERRDVEDFFFEGLTYVAGRVYERQMGSEMPNVSGPRPREPIGEPWPEDPDVLRQRWPRLFARFWR
jgi:hypothetical protein